MPTLSLSTLRPVQPTKLAHAAEAYFAVQLKNDSIPLKSQYLLKFVSIILWFWMMLSLQLKNDGAPLKARFLLKYVSIILLFQMTFSLQLYNNGTPL